MRQVIAGGEPGAGKSTLVARLFEKRQFALVDPPGHERFAQTIVTAAPTAGAALIALDAREGLTPGARRDCAVASLFGLRRLVLAVNKLDLVEFSEEPFRAVEAQAGELAALAGVEAIGCVPACGLHGDNVLTRAGRIPWYSGPTLLEQLEALPVDDPTGPLRLWVQRTPPRGAGVAGFAGTVVGGRAAPGAHVVILPSGRESRIRRILAYDDEPDHALTGRSITLELEDDLELERGDLISAAAPRASVGDQFEATVVWMAHEPLHSGTGCVMRVGTQTTGATVGALKHRLDQRTLGATPANQLKHGQIGVCYLLLGRQIAFDPQSMSTGSFVLLDRITLDPVGAGLLSRALRASQDVCWQAIDVDKASRAAIKRQRPCIVWLTGLPSAGKSTIANELERRLH